VFLLRPSRRTNQIIDYVVAVMADKWQVEVCAIAVMSNHWHVCLYDPHGHVVEFQHDCHQFIARALNAAHGDFESVWTASEPPSRVECEEPDDFVARIAYTLANPVEAGLVRHGHSWPGVRWAWPRKPRVVRRPRQFFRGKKVGGRWPEQALVRASRPPGYDELSDDELAAVIRGAVARPSSVANTTPTGGRFSAAAPCSGSRATTGRARESRASECRPRWHAETSGAASNAFGPTAPGKIVTARRSVAGAPGSATSYSPKGRTRCTSSTACGAPSPPTDARGCETFWSGVRLARQAFVYSRHDFRAITSARLAAWRCLIQCHLGERFPELTEVELGKRRPRVGYFRKASSSPSVPQ